jgi:hypothetical protein
MSSSTTTNVVDQDEASTLLRKLGAAEIVYDYELRLGGMILPLTLLFDTDIDLFEHRSTLEKAIKRWQSVHPLLGAKIVVKPDPNPSHIKFSNERFFSTITTSHEPNVQFLKLVKNTSTDVNNNEIEENFSAYLSLLHERELNLATVDATNGPLWRLIVVEFSRAKTYGIVLTVHHAICDARNGFSLVGQLLEFWQMALDGKMAKMRVFDLLPSIEEKLYANDFEVLKEVKSNRKYDIPPGNKIPTCLSGEPRAKSSRDRFGENNLETRFEFLGNHISESF